MPVSTIVLGVGDYGVTKDPEVELKTFALGSCIAVILYDLRTRTAGMAHIALPDSNINPTRAGMQPAYFADTGIPVLLNSMHSAMGRSDKSGMLVKLAGGANIIRSQAAFNIGARNLEAVRKGLRSWGLSPMAEDVSGSLSRTVCIHNGSGKVTVNSPGRGVWDL